MLVAPRCLVLAGVRVSLGIHLDGLGRALRLDAVALNDAFAHASKLGNTEDPARPVTELAAHLDRIPWRCQKPLAR